MSGSAGFFNNLFLLPRRELKGGREMGNTNKIRSP